MNITDSGEPVSVNNLDAPNREEKFLTLGSLEEIQNENSELNEHYSIGEKMERLSISDTGVQLNTDHQQKSFLQAKTKEPRVNFFTFDIFLYAGTSILINLFNSRPEVGGLLKEALIYLFQYGNQFQISPLLTICYVRNYGFFCA